MFFDGMPPEGLAFLEALAQNNNREWFNERKSIFQKQVQQPAVRLIEALGSRLQMLAPAIRYDTRLNGSGSLFRIYRDVRFSKDKTPYNTHLAIAFWEGAGKKTAHPGFYMQINAQGAKMGSGQYRFPKNVLNAYRDTIVEDEEGEKLETIMAQLAAEGYELGDVTRKRVPRGYDASHPLAKWLLHDGIYAFSELITPEVVCSPDFVDVCFEHAISLLPLEQWLVKLNRTA